MVGSHVIGLSSTEISALWSSYISDSLAICISKYLLKITEDDEVKPLVELSLTLAQSHIETIQHLFDKEKFPIPIGFTDTDVNITAPPLFFDTFPLSYVYSVGRIGLTKYALFLSNTAREDVRNYFTQCLQSTTDLYNRSITLMLSKGVYDRPPMIPYPEHATFIKKKENFLSKWFWPQRTLNVMEISEMFFNIERNYFGLILLTAFMQVVKDEHIKRLLARGKQLSMDQIKFINDKLVQDDLLGTIMVNTEVTTSTVSPFSDKLILNLLNILNSSALTYLGNALSVTTRLDLAGEYSKLMVEVMSFGKDVTDLLIEREWLEEPPFTPDRKKLAGV
ncbi:DUF3231 family protein [Paenibacillus aceris]|uniref:DUF3231 family protein n=1 Tax=Paenibacillus aceris TaxID=869555 RepID=A0ABS4I7E0_9BACL|nr:DUF3231 family protein [Paenibacillus aceris]MBP1966847.1 hypothetical protein [Paenibacillus aceris]NHW38919.1 DUF3231 family protein [Paenibacillus aceris]